MKDLETKGRGTGQHGANLGIGYIISRTFYARFNTWFTFYSRTGGTGLGLRTLHHGATRPRAGRAFSNLARLGTTGNARRTFGNG